MNRNILSLLLVLGLLLPGLASAQVERRVEVSKIYVPDIETATKLPVRPSGVDTTTLQPEIDYTITPLSLTTPLEMEPIRPATMTYWDLDRPLPFYLKVGAGYPGASTLDFYASTQHRDRGYALGYVNHDGRYGRLPQTADKEHRALWQSNRVGGAAGKYFGRYLLEAEADYTHRIYDRYALFPLEEWPTLDAASGRRWGDLQGRIRFGDDLLAADRFDFNIEVTAGNWWNPLTGADRRDGGQLFGEAVPEPTDQWNLGAQALLAFRAKRDWSLRLRIGFDGNWGGDSRYATPTEPESEATAYDYYKRTYSGTLLYGFHRGKVEFDAGLSYYRDEIAGRDASNYILPHVNLRFNLGRGGFVPFVRADGRVQSNTLRELIAENPYYRPALSGPMPKSTVDYAFSVGVGGDLVSGRLSYRLYLDYTLRENHNYWYAFADPVGQPAGFDFKQGRLDILTLHGELQYRPVSGLMLGLSAAGHSYSERQTITLPLPEGEVEAEVRYTHRKFSLGAAFRLEGAYSLTLFDASTSDPVVLNYCRIPLRTQLDVEAEWYLTRSVTLFVQGLNLTNRPLYDWNKFPQYGAGFLVGAKLNF